MTSDDSKVLNKMKNKKYSLASHCADAFRIHFYFNFLIKFHLLELLCVLIWLELIKFKVREKKFSIKAFFRSRTFFFFSPFEYFLAKTKTGSDFRSKIKRLALAAASGFCRWADFRLIVSHIHWEVKSLPLDQLYLFLWVNWNGFFSLWKEASAILADWFGLELIIAFWNILTQFQNNWPKIEVQPKVILLRRTQTGSHFRFKIKKLSSAFIPSESVLKNAEAVESWKISTPFAHEWSLGCFRFRFFLTNRVDIKEQNHVRHLLE